jgi:hypothetical protein
VVPAVFGRWLQISRADFDGAAETWVPETGRRQEAAWTSVS